MPGERPAVPPALGVALAVLSVSFAAPLFRLADAPALTASFWRLALAIVLLLPFTRGAWGAWRRYRAADWGLLALAGLSLAAHFGLWVTSLFMTSVAASTSLVTLQAVFVALGGHWILGDRLARAAWAGVALATAGVLLITLGDGGWGSASRRALLGDLVALAAGLGSAAYFLVGRRLRATRGLVEYVTPVYAFAALALLLALPFAGQPVATGFSSRAFLFFVLLAAVPMLGGHTVANWCLRYLPAHTVATWILLEPVGAALLAWPMLGEVPGPWTAAGGALVLAGAAMTVPREAKPAG
ncbi:MAG TPA: DMT family transporter [Candidatus Thermoplasmatota archaeon]|nr:DMT family transporter [Candidatus Thermoplasmatota archaeon]